MLILPFSTFKILIGMKSENVRVLMVGYNGANNTGAEALLLSDIQDVRSVLGEAAHITVPTLNEANLRRYLAEGPALRIAPIPTLFFASIYKLVRESDLVLLVEGSTYMDTWGSPLLWAFLWASDCARRMGKPCLAYAVDAGTLKPANAHRVKQTASRTDLIITRNQAAAARLKAVGATAPMLTTADNAFNFQPRATDAGWLAREWPRAAGGAVGFAAVDFNLFPAVMRPWGPKEECYKWPYYFSTSPERRNATDKAARTYAAVADSVVSRTGKAAALICMEQLDEAMAHRIQGYMAHRDQARVFSAREQDASRMISLLRGLDLLVTSRCHAGVLSLAGTVPQIAVGHDTRLDTLYRDLGIREEWFLRPEELSRLGGKVDKLLENPEIQKETLRRGYEEHLSRAKQNRRLLSRFVAEYIPGLAETKRMAEGEPAWAT
jgi:polysaccharide pyruvyl transferase WcaK-like protein